MFNEKELSSKQGEELKEILKEKLPPKQAEELVEQLIEEKNGKRKTFT